VAGGAHLRHDLLCFREIGLRRRGGFLRGGGNGNETGRSGSEEPVAIHFVLLLGDRRPPSAVFRQINSIA
jgi:hypothetical protein